MIQIKEKDKATHYNKKLNTWGFIGCDADIYKTQDEAYDAYLDKLMKSRR